MTAQTTDSKRLLSVAEWSEVCPRCGGWLVEGVPDDEEAAGYDTIEWCWAECGYWRTLRDVYEEDGDILFHEIVAEAPEPAAARPKAGVGKSPPPSPASASYVVSRLAIVRPRA